MADLEWRREYAMQMAVDLTAERDVLRGKLAEVERERDELRPAPCDMRQGEPYDFAWCETHDTTFPLGSKCKFDGHEPWEVYAEEEHEQRVRAVRAETERDFAAARADAAEARLEAVRELVLSWPDEGSGYYSTARSRCKRQILAVLDAEVTDRSRNEPHAWDGNETCWCGRDEHAVLHEIAATAQPDKEQRLSEPTTVSIAIQISPFLMKTDVPFVGDVQALAEQMTRYVATNLSQRFTEQHENAGLFVAVSAKRGDDMGGHEYREGHFVKPTRRPDAEVTNR